jgi:hypothetical protein
VLEVVSVPNEYTLKIYEFCGILYRLDYKMFCGILDKRNELDGLGGLLVETFYIRQERNRLCKMYCMTYLVYIKIEPNSP